MDSIWYWFPGKQKISRRNAKIALDKYEEKLENANVEIILNKKISEKLDKETVEVIFKDKKSTHKVKYENNKMFVIRIKNV